MQNPTLPPLLSQLEGHWNDLLRPRLEGLTDAEYFWEPVPGCWNIRPVGSKATATSGGSGAWEVDFAFPEPTPAPVTTIAWRLAHVIVGVFAMRVGNHFGGPVTDYFQWEYAGTAAEALDQLDSAYAAWVAGVRGLGEDGLEHPCGSAEGPYAEHPMVDLVTHITREVIHHGAEICLLRDLYAHSYAQ